MKKILTLFILFTIALYGQNGDFEISITGNLKENNSFTTTPAKLNSLLQTESFHTFNPWEEKADRYEGFMIDTFIKKFAKDNIQKITFKALDNYEITFTKPQWENERILVATKVNSEFISIRNRGPMRIVFVDYDPDDEKYKKTLTSWMWMITSIRVE